jgi:ketopantoate hydroxymethyltransferase
VGVVVEVLAVVPEEMADEVGKSLMVAMVRGIVSGSQSDAG